MKLEWFIKMRHGSSAPSFSMPMLRQVKSVARRSPADKSLTSVRSSMPGLFGFSCFCSGKASTSSYFIAAVLIFIRSPYSPHFLVSALYHTTKNCTSESSAHKFSAGCVFPLRSASISPDTGAAKLSQRQKSITIRKLLNKIIEYTFFYFCVIIISFCINGLI